MAAIQNPLNYVRRQAKGFCVKCERDFKDVFSHSKYPSMRLCKSCSADYNCNISMTAPAALEIQPWMDAAIELGYA